MVIATDAIEKAQIYSEDLIEKLRSQLKDSINSKSICIVTVGSFARREASPESDIDYFIIYDEKSSAAKTEAENALDFLISEINRLKIRQPAPSGAFSILESCSEITHNLGGFHDSTSKLTRRLLFLLEGDWLYNEALFMGIFNKFIETYVKSSITEHQLCRFLLNDLIRYYRTICVDFEYKTSEDGKSWGDRNIKLMFSRKLMYFSGILVIAETVQHNYRNKRYILQEYLRKTPINRIMGICGLRSEKALAMYTDFLDKMSQPDVREMLKNTNESRTAHSEEFRTFKNKGHHFTWELSRLLSETYDSANPIHLAIKF